MDPPQRRSQHDWFYDEDWTPEIDKTFVEVLVDEAGTHDLMVGANLTHSLSHALWVIRFIYHKEVPFMKLHTRYKILKRRYLTFSNLLKWSGVVYDTEANRVRGAENLWDQLEERHPIFGAYREAGESNWDELQIIFATLQNV